MTLEFLQTIRLSDLLDIAILAVLFYRFFILIQGTRTIPILVGLTVILGGTYLLARVFLLDATGWLVENIVGSSVVLLVVLFQQDISKVLAQVGLNTMFRELSSQDRTNLVDVVVQTAHNLAKRKIGALIVIEGEGGLRDYIEKGKPLLAQPSVELLESIFHTSSPLHDGAVIINQAGKVAAASCILPLSDRKMPRKMGTRHRAALGLSLETDAIVVVVSEERGQISMVYQGDVMENLEKNDLRDAINLLIQTSPKAHAKTSNPSHA